MELTMKAISSIFLVLLLSINASVFAQDAEQADPTTKTTQTDAEPECD
jgi:hypothetical protein